MIIPNELKKLVKDTVSAEIAKKLDELITEIQELKAKLEAQAIEIKVLKEGDNI